MPDFNNTPLIKPAAVIRGAFRPERTGRITLQRLVEAGEIIPRNGFLTPTQAEVFWHALHGRVDDEAA